MQIRIANVFLWKLPVKTNKVISLGCSDRLELLYWKNIIRTIKCTKYCIYKNTYTLEEDSLYLFLLNYTFGISLPTKRD